MTISQLFKSNGDAMEAERELREAGLDPNAIQIVDPRPDATADELVQAGIERAEAEATVEAVRSGETLLIVSAPFGTARQATRILERNADGGEAPDADANEADRASSARARRRRESAAPAATASSQGNTLSTDWTLSGALGLRLLVPSDWTASEALGVPLLSHPETEAGKNHPVSVEN
jgi:hypothetical protein